ncbi:MAG: hypothetical protein LBP79_00365 [Clostridiales bacterium]|jgi:hypothetical protein|nr:hypothetical protein [Clostridiales bacterium]
MVFAEKVFERYFLGYLADNKISKPSRIEEVYASVYAEWKCKPSDDLGGDFPLGYIAGLYADGRFADYLVELCESKLKAGDISLEFIASLPADEKVGLLKTVFKKGGAASRLFAVSAAESETDPAFTEFLADIIFDHNEYERKITDAAFDALKTERTGLDSLILARTDGLRNIGDEELKEMLLDILSGYGGEIVKNAVTEGLLESGNVILYANLLGRCGDGGSAETLTEYARSKELTRAEFIEIRNAVERLGGELTEEF